MPFVPPKTLDETIKMFDPERISKMFDVEQFGAALMPPGDLPFDVDALIATSTKNVAALQAANKSAAAAYRSFLQKQAEIFDELTAAAHEQIKSLEGGGTEDIVKRQQEIRREAVEKAVDLMTEFASTMQAAQEEAARIIDAHLKDTLAELRGAAAEKG